MSRVVFLLEERSLRVLLEGLLPRQFPGLPFLCIEHEGKSDLEKSRFRDPDAVVQPSKVLEELLPEFQKVSGARLMAGVLARERNTSASFRVFMDGVEREARAMAGRAPRGGG